MGRGIPFRAELEGHELPDKKVGRSILLNGARLVAVFSAFNLTTP